MSNSELLFTSGIVKTLSNLVSYYQVAVIIDRCLVVEKFLPKLRI